jgi:acyl-CoA synthetase (AMP-forming)/AMP-acid ligase II
MAITDLPAVLREAINRSPGELAMEFDGRGYPWRFAADIAAQLEDALARLGMAEHERVGFIAHTRPAHVAALWGLMIARRCPSMIYGYQSQEKLAADIGAQRYPLVIADRRDWTEATIAAAREAGSAGLALSEEGSEWVPGLEQVGARADRNTVPGAAVETLSSGTTGDPKRILLSMQNLAASATAAAASIRQMSGEAAARTPLIVVLPLANISGVYATVPAGLTGHPIALLEKFQVDRWLELVRRLRPATADVPPAALAMLLKSGIRREDLASVRVIRTGAAPLDPEVHRVYAEDFGIPINLSYGASEFCGVITTWTMEDLAQYEKTKRGSCGRALPGVSLRVVDRDSGDILGPDCVGLLQARAERVGPHWIRTTDLVRVDADGFMWFEGRADATIFRGGFKIAPETVADVLRNHPGVRDAAVTGVPDERLGEVPVAAVEALDSDNPPSAAELEAHARRHLAAFQVPVRFIFMDELPRTPSLKLNIARLKELLSGSR